MDDGWTIVECGNCLASVRESDLTAWGQCSGCETEYQQWEEANNKWATDEEVANARKAIDGWTATAGGGTKCNSCRLNDTWVQGICTNCGATEKSEASQEPTREEIAAAFGVEPQDIPEAPPSIRDVLSFFIAEWVSGESIPIATDALLKRFEIKEKS